MNERLFDAARNGDLRLLRDLFENHKEDVNSRDVCGNTALHLAARAGQIPVIVYLLEHPGTDVCVENDNNETAFDLAWDSAGNHKLHTPAWESIGKVYSEKEKLIARQSGKQLHQTQHREADETLSEATFVGNLYHQLSQDDLRRILQFFCRPLPNEHNFGQVLIAVTFMLNVEEDKFVRLLKFENSENIFFVPFWDKNSLNPGEAKYDIKVEAIRPFHPDSDPYKDKMIAETLALLKLRLACDWLSTFGMPKQKKKMENFDAASFRQELNRVKINIQSFEDGRRLFANILNETNSTNEKMKFICTFLETVLDREKDFGQFSFRTANALVFFLEAYALEGIRPRMTLTPEATKTLSQKKKKYYLQFYPEKQSGTSYHKIIETLRNSILHTGGNTSVSLESLNNFFRNEVTMNLKEIFEQLLVFSKLVWTNVKNNSHIQPESSDLEKVFDLIEKQVSNNFLKTERLTKEESNGNASSEALLRRFCENVKNMLGGIDVHHQLLFDLVVNIQPKIQIDKSSWEKPEVHSLRNSLVHDFSNITLQKLREDIPFAVHDLYRYELASCINQILVTFRQAVDPADLEQQFTTTLKTVDKKYENFEYYPLNQTPKGHLKCNFNGPSWMKNSKYVEIYIKYMVPLFDVQRGEDKEESLMNTQAEINVMQKREVYEYFWRLDNAFNQSREEEYITCQKKLRQFLKESLHVGETDARFMTDLKGNKNAERNESFQKKVKGFLDSLEALRAESHFKRRQLSSQDIIVLYSSFAKNEKDQLWSGELTADEIEIVKDRLASFPDCKQVEEIFSGTEKLQVNVSSVILNLLRMSSEMQPFYQLKIEGIATVFSDATFLHYLVSHAIDKTMKFHDKNLTYRVIRNIRDISFTVPYVASLLSKTKSLEVIEDDLLLKVIVSLIQRYPSEVYLRDLLSLDDKRLMELFPKVLFENELSDENMRTFLDALTKAQVLTSCTKSLQLKFGHDYPGEIKQIVRRYLWAAIDVLLVLIDGNTLNDADDILEHVRIFCERLTEENEDKDILTHFYLLEAKIHIRRAQEICSKKYQEERAAASWGGVYRNNYSRSKGNCGGAAYCDRALHVLLHIPKPQDTSDYPRYMLALARKCASYEIKGKCSQNISLSHAAIKHFKELVDLLWQYVTSENGPAPSFEILYSRVNDDKKYIDLIGEHREYSKYLNLLKIYDSLNMQKFIAATNSSSSWRSRSPHELIGVLTIWFSLYTVRKKQGDSIHARRAVIRLRRRIGFVHNELFKIYRDSRNPADISKASYHRIKSAQSFLLNYETIRLQQGPHAVKLRGTIFTIACYDRLHNTY